LALRADACVLPEESAQNCGKLRPLGVGLAFGLFEHALVLFEVVDRYFGQIVAIFRHFRLRLHFLHLICTFCQHFSPISEINSNFSQKPPFFVDFRKFRVIFAKSESLSIKFRPRMAEMSHFVARRAFSIEN